MWNWYEWDTIESFNLWHDAICVKLGYPLDSYNQETGEIDPDAMKTISYTGTWEREGKIIAKVEEEHSFGLNLTNLRPPVEITK
jgi:hypothetical protein